MPQRQLPERGELQIDTPVIDIQDLEHQPAPETRVNDAGVKVRSRFETHEPEPEIPDINLADEDEKAREAIRKFEESVANLPPG